MSKSTAITAQHSNSFVSIKNKHEIKQKQKTVVANVNTNVSAPDFLEPKNPSFGMIFETRNPGIFWCKTRVSLRCIILHEIS